MLLLGSDASVVVSQVLVGSRRVRGRSTTMDMDMDMDLPIFCKYKHNDVILIPFARELLQTWDDNNKAQYHENNKNKDNNVLSS